MNWDQAAAAGGGAVWQFANISQQPSVCTEGRLTVLLHSLPELLPHPGICIGTLHSCSSSGQPVPIWCLRTPLIIQEESTTFLLYCTVLYYTHTVFIFDTLSYVTLLDSHKQKEVHMTSVQSFNRNVTFKALRGEQGELFGRMFSPTTINQCPLHHLVSLSAMTHLF